MSTPEVTTHMFRMMRAHRLFTATVLLLIGVLLVLPVAALTLLLPVLPRWIVVVAALLVAIICECYFRQMFAVFTVTPEGLAYRPRGTFSRRWATTRHFTWRDYSFRVYRALPKQREMKIWRGIWLPIYLTNPGVQLHTLQFYTDSFLGMYAVIGICRRDTTVPSREMWLGVPQCIDGADSLLHAIVANGGVRT